MLQSIQEIRQSNRSRNQRGLLPRRAGGGEHSEIVDAKLLTKKMREEVEGNSRHAVSESSGPASPAEAELD